MKLNEIKIQDNNRAAAMKWLEATGYNNFNDMDFSDGKINFTHLKCRNFFLNQHGYPYSHRLYELPFEFGKVIGDFTIIGTNMRNLKGLPKEIGRSLLLEEMHKLESIDGLRGCKISRKLSFVACGNEGDGISLEGIHEIEFTTGYGIIDFHLSKIRRGGVGLLLVKNLSTFWGYEDNPDTPKEPFQIINEYLGRPEDIYECQSRLIDNGFEEFAVI